MSNQQGDNPPSAPPAGAYGPGHTLLGEPDFVAEQPAPVAFAPPAPHAGAMVPATVFDASAYVPPPPQYPVSPYAGGTAPAAGYGMQSGPIPPTASYGAPAPSPYGAPQPPAYPVAPPRRAAAGAGGPPLIVIGLAAFAVIGGLTTFLALRGRGSSSESDKPIPTIDVPPAATVPADPGPGVDPNEPPPVEPPPFTPPAATVPVHVAPKPTATAPKPTPTATTPIPTATSKPVPSPTTPPTTPPKPGGKGPILIPRRPIPKTR